MTAPEPLIVNIFVDGNETPLLGSILAGWQREWDENYGHVRQLVFEGPVNLKTAAGAASLPPVYREVAEVRNPDLFFFERTLSVSLGGVEITDHSPDGSNADKRYPYLWASRRHGLAAFILCPYQKGRASGQTNRLPFRHSRRNLDLLHEWTLEAGGEGSLQQIVPISDLQLSGATITTSVLDRLLSAEQVGGFFAHLLALKSMPAQEKKSARASLEVFKTALTRLAIACRNNAKLTEPSSLIRLPNKWVQIYNTRPDSGHWERGEGQFDSIDGRVMFTLDGVSLLPPSQRPAAVELWLPQLVRSHPWVAEQLKRGFQSKRFRNLMVILADDCPVKFADDLTQIEWGVLAQNPRLTLERLDPEPQIYSMETAVKGRDIPSLAAHGLKNPSNETVRSIVAVLGDANLYVSSHRAYRLGWGADLMEELAKLPPSATVLVPRIGERLLLTTIERRPRLVPAERVTKAQLLALRQLHRQ